MSDKHSDSQGTSNSVPALHIWRTRIATGLLGGTVTALLIYGVQQRAHAHLNTAVNLLVFVLATELDLFFGGIDALVGIKLDVLLQSYPLLVGFVAGFYCGAFRESVWKTFHHRLFRSADKQILIPFPYPHPYDPLWGSILSYAFDKDGEPLDKNEKPLAWLTPTEGQRHEAWIELWDFMSEGSSDGRFTILSGRPRSPDFRPFAWTVLTGRSGSGKTRMGIEFLRYQLACWARLEALDHTWWDRKKIAWGEWRRRVSPWSPRKDGDPRHGKLGDPWDVGWIRQRSSPRAGEYASRERNYEYLAKLAKWEPRRPTAFLLDDPLIHDAKDIIERFLCQAHRYCFPVRLLIVNQTMPEELIEIIGEPRDWRLKKGGFYGRVVVLSDEACLSKDEILGFATQLGPPLRNWKADDPEVRAHIKTLHGITKGNPLLVELALRRFVEGSPIESLKADELLSDRADRILRTLMLAHRKLGPSDFRALASATLAGPEPVTGAATKAAGDAFGPHSEALQRCFNLTPPRIIAAKRGVEPDGQYLGLPVVRPEGMGDAFVQLVLKRYCHSEEWPDEDVQNNVAAVAWRFNPAGVLRAVERTASRSDELGGVMRVGPPPNVSVDAMALAQAYAVASCHYVAGQPWPTGASSEALSVTCRQLLSLPPELAAKCVPHLFGLFHVDRTITGVWPSAASICFFHAVGRVIEAGTPLLQSLDIPDLTKMACRAMDEWFEGPVIWKRKAFKWIEPLSVPNEERFACSALEALARLGDSSSAAQPQTDVDEELRASIWRWVASSKGTAGEVPGCQAAAEKVDEIARPFSGEKRFELLRAKTWPAVIDAKSKAAGDVAGCEAAAEKVHEITRPFAGDKEFELERAKAWRFVGIARSKAGDVAGCEAAAEKVDEIARPFAGDKVFQLERAVSWCSVGFDRATAGDVAGCEVAAEKVDEIAAPFAGDNALELHRVIVWEFVGYAKYHASDVAGCEAAAEKVDVIAHLFAGENVFQLERAVAWDWVGVAKSHSGDAGGCEAAAEKVDEIARPFGGEKELELHRVDAWQCVAAVRSNSGDVARCEAAAEMVDEIARRFAGEEKFELNRAATWFVVVRAGLKAGDVLGCEAAAQEVDEITQPFSGKEEFEVFGGWAWELVCGAKSNAGDVAGCEVAAEKVDQIARPFSGQDNFQLYRANAWQYVCGAKSNAGDVPGCDAAAQKVEEIARPFSGEKEFELKRAWAWRFVCGAKSNAGDVPGCDAAVQKVDEIVRPFMGEMEFELERAKAWRFACGAKSKTGDVAGSEAAAEKVDEIARPFSAEEEFALECAMARRMVTNAKSNNLGAQSSKGAVE